MQLVEYEMKAAPPLRKQGVASLRSKLEQVKNLVKGIGRRHFNTVTRHSVKV